MKSTNYVNEISERVDQMEARITQLEIAKKNTITFATLAAFAL